MDFSKALPRPELLAMATHLSDEKNIPREKIIEILEQAMMKVASNQYGHEHDLVVSIDQKTGGILVKRIITVVENGAEKEEDFNENRHILLKDVKDKELKVEDKIEDFLPPLYFGRQSFQSVRQFVIQSIRSEDRERQFEEFKDRAGELVSCSVLRNEYGNVIVDIGGHGEGFLRRNELIPREVLNSGDRIRAYILEVTRTNSGPQILLSRSHPDFMAKLFEQEVPEVYEGEIQIKAVAREPGSHAKIAVSTDNPTIDPIGTCVGMRGARIHPVINELQGEKIDVILWSADPAQFAVNAITPAKASKVVVDEKEKKIEIAVPQDQLSMAIGRKGQNIRLASRLMGWRLDVMNEEDEQTRRAEEVKELLELFTKALDIDEVVARLLLLEGFRTLEEVAFVSKEELMEIEGFEEELVGELQERAKAFLDDKDKEFKDKVSKLKIHTSLLELEGFSDAQKLKLGEAKIKTSEDVADLSAGELCEILPDVSQKRSEEIIMKLRESWFEEEENPEPEE
jgi:N utilization substance protein A